MPQHLYHLLAFLISSLLVLGSTPIVRAIGLKTGLVDRPVIGVPTSVGYGAGAGGIAALLGMLNGCAAGLTVVNVDNGFGAAYAATQMNRRRDSEAAHRGSDG